MRASCESTFQAITLNLDFTVYELELLSADTALLRTHSNGAPKGNGTETPAGRAKFKELFLLNREADGAWRCSPYSFSAIAQ